MTWRTRMQPASFRGAGFLVEGHDGEVGRRLAVHEYPERDLPYAEDLGRKARVFKITGLVIGPDYMAQRDALLDWPFTGAWKRQPPTRASPRLSGWAAQLGAPWSS
jgi:prophage DNA circulation protein